MKSLSKKLLVALLSVGMVVTMIPFTAFPAEAATNLDGGLEGQDADVFSALGFDTEELPEGYDPDTTDNPYGRDKIPGNQVFELAVAGGSGTTDYGKGNNDVKASDISGIPDGTGLDLTMSASAAGDFDGDGLAGEIVYVGYDSTPYATGPNEADLSLRIYNGKTGAYGIKKKIGTVHPKNTYITGYSFCFAYEYQWMNLLQVSTGDYDGDGICEIAVFVAEKDNPRVDIYKYQKNSDSRPGDWVNMGNWGRVWSHALGGTYVPNMVSLVSGDFNRDGVDDLGISYGSAISYLENNIYGEASRAVMLWGDRERMLQTSSPLDLNTAELGDQVRVSLTKGDLDQDGNAELIATGHPLTNFNTPGGYIDIVNAEGTDDGQQVSHEKKFLYYGNWQRTAITYQYDETNGLVINTSDLLEPVKGSYSTMEMGNIIVTSWGPENGFDADYYSLPSMRTNATVFKPAGEDYAYLYLDSCLYEYMEGTLSLKCELDEEKYDGENSFGLDGKNWGSRKNGKQEYYAEYGAAAADINGNGEQILVVNSSRGDSHVAVSAYQDATYSNQYAVVNGTSDGKLKANITDEGSDSSATYKGQSTTFFDNDVDTVIMEYTGEHYLTYSDPKILAVIAAAPYFEDVDEATGYEFAGNNTNAWGMTNGNGDSTTVSVDLSVGGFGSHELQGAGHNFGIEWAANVTFSYEKSWTTSYEYTMTFGTYGDQDAIAFYSIPTENYIYRIKTPDGKGGYTVDEKPVTKTYQPAYQVLTLDYYESIRKGFENVLPKVRGTAIKSTPGDPASYPSSYSEFKKDDIIVKWDKDGAGVGYGNGSITQEISVSKEEETAYSLGAEIEFKLGGGHKVQLDPGQAGFENQWGGGFSINPAGGWAETYMKGTTIEAEVANMPVEFQPYGYYFNWKLFSYYYNFGDVKNEKQLSFEEESEAADEFDVDDDAKIGMATSARIPVITFAVSDVRKPPTLPDDFQQDYDRTTSDTNVMTWTYDDKVTSFIIYKQFDFPVGGGLQKIGRIEPGDSDHYTIKYDEKGKLYKEYFFADTNLSPYTEYQYAIQVERLDPTPPLSTPSALVTARTKSENGYPKITISESDEDQDGKLLVYPDKNAYLTAGVTGPEGETINNYYSVVQYQWQKKNKGAWEDVVIETNKTLTFASAGADTEGEYRCRVNVITKADNVAITAYSDSVELTHAKRTSYMKEVSVTDVTGGGIQLYAEVGNAHKDSASIPGGTVTFTLTSGSSGQTYQYTKSLSAAGTVTAVMDDVLPEGMYSVEAYYSGSYIFKSCMGETLYLSQRSSGYDIDLPSTVTYGDEAEIVFREVSKTDGVTTTKDVDAGVRTMYRATPLSRAALSGAVDYTEGSNVTAGTKYRYTDGDGMKWYFTAPVDGVPDFDVETGYATFGSNLAPDQINQASGLNNDGHYLLKAGTPTGVYLISMKKSVDSETAFAAIEVVARPVTLQIPKNLSEGESTEEAADIIFKDLSIVTGSWADCDITNDVFKYADNNIDPKYFNTAGKEFDKTNVLAFCGAYTVVGTAELPNYKITWRSGQLTVLGAANDVKIGVRKFDGLNVGKLYMMSPEIAVATDPLGEPNMVTKRIQAGVKMVFSAQPDDGYEIYDWYINGKAQNNKNSIIAYTMLAEDTRVEVQFAIKQNTFTFGTAGDENGGTLTCNDISLTSGSVVRRNAAFTFTAKAAEGYHFKEWRYTEQGLGTSYDDEDKGKDMSTFDFVMPNINCSLYAVFERDGYVFNYIDGNNAAGLTASYENEEGKTVTARSGEVIKGGTVITVAPASGYNWDDSRQYVSQGAQGVANEDGSYTLTLNQDTTVYGWTKQQVYSLKLGYGLARTSQMVPDATITYYIGDQEYTFTCAEYLNGGGNDVDEAGYRVVENIPGGTPVTVSVDVPGWVDLKGWTANDTRITSTTEKPGLLVTAIEAGGAVEKNKSYSYITGDGVTRYFTSPVNGTADWIGDTVTVYSSSVRYTIPALDKNEKLTVYLKEKPVHTVTLANISENGEYEYTLPEGGFEDRTANEVKVHDGDDFTVRVIPYLGKTVSYWKTTPENSEPVTRPATSLRYTIPGIVANYAFEPIFSTTTYNLISWPTISEKLNHLSVNPESGYITRVASGEDFEFKLSGASLKMVEAVYANGQPFGGQTVGGTTYSYDSDTGVYSIKKLTENQEITVKFKEIGVTVNGVDISNFTGTGWTYDTETQTLTLNRSNLTLSGRNDPELAPNLKIVATDAVGSLTLNSLTIDSEATEPLLELDGTEVFLTAIGKNSLKQTGKASAVLAKNDLVVRGNGTVEISGPCSNNYSTVQITKNLTLRNTVQVKVESSDRTGRSQTVFAASTLTVGLKNNNSHSPTLHVIGNSYYTAELGEAEIYGGEATFTNTSSDHAFGLYLVGDIKCFGGVLEVSGVSKAVNFLDYQEIQAYYPEGYMCRVGVSSGSYMDDYATTYKTYSKLTDDYSSEDTAGDKYDLVDKGGSSIDPQGKRAYIRLSPLSGDGKNDEMILSVKYPAGDNGVWYSHNVLEDKLYSQGTTYCGWYYYIDNDNPENGIQVISMPELSTTTKSLPEGAVVIAENLYYNDAPYLYFTRLTFKKKGPDQYGYNAEAVENPTPLDYAVSGSVSGDITNATRGAIYANGRIFSDEAAQFYDKNTGIRSLTLDNLTHVNLCAKDYPIILKGDNYLIASTETTSTPFTLKVSADGQDVKRDLDLRSDGSGTLTVSVNNEELALSAKDIKLTNVGALTLFSKGDALEANSVTYYSDSTELPYGIGWKEDVGSKAGDAVDQSSVVANPAKEYVKFYATSTDAKAVPEKLIFDKSDNDTNNTITKLTPPTEMGVPKLFVPAAENSVSKVELIKGTGTENNVILACGTDKDYTYTPDEDGVNGKLVFDLSTDNVTFKDLEIGEYTLKVYFTDSDILDIPLEVRDTEHITGDLKATPEKIILIRDKSANITTAFTGTTPSEYEWTLSAVDPDGSTEGLVLTPGSPASTASVTANKNAALGDYKVTVASYAGTGASITKLGEVNIPVTVAPQPKSIDITCATETPSGDQSYMLNHNTLDGSARSWTFDATITMDDGSVLEDPEITWSQMYGSYSQTKAEKDPQDSSKGILTIDPHETGIEGSGELLLWAKYMNEDGTPFEKAIRIRLSEDAIVGYTQAPEGGTINAAQVTNAAGTPIPKNTEVTFTAAPETDYAVDTWYINGQPVEEGVDGNTMTFTTEKMGRYSVWATFAKEKNYVVTYEKTGAGTITAETENGTLASGDKVAGGTSVTFTAVPDSYHKISAWYVNDEKQEGEPGDTLTPNINSDVNVRAEFTVPERTITITASEHGSVTFLVDGVILADPVTEDNGKYTLHVPANQTVTALAVPEENYSVNQWSNLEGATAADAICTIPRGMEDAKATVSFKGQVQHKVTINTNSYDNGAGTVEVGSDIVPMSDSKTFYVAEGGSLVLTAVPDAGSTLYDWTVEPESYKDYMVDGNLLTLTNVTEDVTANATFRRGSNKLTLVKDGVGSLTAKYDLTIGTQELENGTLEADGNQIIRAGATVIVTVTPASGQIPSTFTVNGEDKSAELVKDPNEVKYTYQIGALTEDTEIKAVFEEMVRYDVTGHADYTVEETVELENPEDPEADPTTTEKTIGTVVITEFGAGNGFNEVTGADPQKVSVIPNTPVEITFKPAEGYLVDTGILSSGVTKILTEADSKAAFSFKQSAKGTILRIEGIDKALNFSSLENPFVEQKEDDAYVTLTMSAGDQGSLTVTNAEDHVQYLNGASVLKGTEITYSAQPNEHYNASVMVNNETVATEGTRELTGDTSIQANFSQSEHKVTITTLGKGTGSVTINNEAYEPGEYWLEAGRELSIAAVAAKGSGVSSFTVDGSAVFEGSKTVTLNKDIAVIAAFSDTMRTVTYNSPANGKLQLLDAEGKTVESGTSVSIGSKLYVVKTPDAHYTLKTLTVGGTELSGDYFVVDEERGNDVFCEFTRAEDKVTWIAVYGTVDAQLMPEGDPIGNGEYVPSGSQIKFRVTPKNSNYSLESLTVNGKAMSPSNYYEADQEDVEAVAICEYTGDVPGVKEGVKVSMLPVNCTMAAELEDGTPVKNGEYVKTGDKIKFTYKPTNNTYTLDKFTVIGAEPAGGGMYVAGSEDIIASAVYNAPSTTIINDPGVPLAPDATYTVLIDSGDGGSVDVTIKGEPVKSGSEVDLGSKLTIKAVPDEGRQVKSLTVNGVKFQNGEEYVVYANTLIKAEFEEATTETGLPCYKDDRGSTVYSGFSYDLNGDGVYTEDEYIIPKDVEVHFQENHKYFEDMPGNWADEYIQFVGDREIFQGVTDTLFDPEGKVTRAMYVTVIGRLYERSFGTINGGTAKNFTDCDYDSWYGKYVDWAAATGVVNGYDEKTFGPNDNVTREQMAAILTRFAKLMKLDTSAKGDISFTDSEAISDYAVDSVRYCVDKGIITGYEDGRFAPQDNATRAQIAAVIVRYIESVLSE